MRHDSLPICIVHFFKLGVDEAFDSLQSNAARRLRTDASFNDWFVGVHSLQRDVYDLTYVC